MIGNEEEGIYSFRPFGAPPSYTGLPQRFCEAKDLWEEGEQVFSWQRHGVALTTCELGNGTWSVLFPDRARFLPRETSGHRSPAPMKEGRRNLPCSDEEARGAAAAPARRSFPYIYNMEGRCDVSAEKLRREVAFCGAA